MSKIEVDAITQQSGSTLTVGGGASKTVVADATTVTLGRCGGTVALASGATQSGFGRTGTVDWQTTVKTGDFTAVSGEGYFVNITSGAITVTLPASPSVGDIVAVSDYAQNSQNNNITLGRNSSNIQGDASDLVIKSKGLAMTLVYADATKGWIVVYAGAEADKEPIETFVSATGGAITEDGDFKVHTFTGPGTFTVTCVADTSASNEVSYIVVAGGGGGGKGGGGGGAGGFRESRSGIDTYSPASPLEGATNITVTAQAYPIAVGGGGAGQTSSPSSRGSNGVNSTFSTVTSAGGAGGGSHDNVAGKTGGSGGGNGNGSAAAGESAKAGNTPPVSPPQGQPGGASGNPNGAPAYGASGGGGAGATGGASSSSAGGAGGAGVATSITGSAVTRSGGGGGSVFGGSNQGAGGSGGGGAGGPGSPPGAATAGTTNTGGGGGGGGNGSAGNGGSGGSGIVIIRYKFQ